MSNDWFWEGNVVESLERHFRDLGWTFVSKADTASRQTGIDLHMQKDGIELRIEAKGYPSEFYQRGPKEGMPKRTAPSTQARHWYSEALLCAILRQNDHPDSIVAIAFPEFPVFTNMANRTNKALERLALRVIFVTETGDVKVIGTAI